MTVKELRDAIAILDGDVPVYFSRGMCGLRDKFKVEALMVDDDSDKDNSHLALVIHTGNIQGRTSGRLTAKEKR